MNRGAASTVTLVVLSQVVHFLTFGAIALLLPLIREDLGISFSQAGLLSAAATLSYAMTQIPAGYVCDRYGPKRLFFAGLLGWSLLGVALSLAYSYWMAVAILFAAGACRALLFAPGLTLVASWFPPDRRATAMGIFLVGSFLGTMGVSLTGPALSEVLGWRMTFGSYALLGVATAVAFWKFAGEKPRAERGARVRLRDAGKIIRSRVLWVCNALQFVRFSVATAFNFWLPSLLLADRGLSLSLAGLIVALSAACAAAANPLGGYLSDRLRNPPLVIGASLAVLACSSVLLVTVESLPVLLAVIAVNSVFMTIYFGPLFYVPVEVFGQRTAGLVTGVGNLFANLGALTAAYALGVIKDATGSFTQGFLGIAGLCVVGVILSIALARMRTRALAPETRVGFVHTRSPELAAAARKD
ncbi:MAG TPA: MFS transporter [Burkholderiales bacterium]|nr:MFS transporter [Burkholderiales bacterium]